MQTRLHRRDVWNWYWYEKVFAATCILMSDALILLLVFSKCFRAGFGAFSTFKYRVKRGTNLCNLWVILMLKTYLMFISVGLVHSVCHYWWLIDVWKDESNPDFVYFFQQRPFLHLRVIHCIKHHMQTLGHDICVMTCNFNVLSVVINIY